MKICHLVRLFVYVFTKLRESLGPRREQAGLKGPLAMWLEASQVPLLGLSFPICLTALCSVDRDESTADGILQPHRG